MNISFSTAQSSDLEALVAIRLAAMQPSLETVGRFNPDRARERFVSKFKPDNTTLIDVDGKLAGFFVLMSKSDHLWLNDLYVDPEFQGSGIGTAALKQVIARAENAQLPIKLMALKGSDANDFYTKHDFRMTHSEAIDNYYTRACVGVAT